MMDKTTSFSFIKPCGMGDTIQHSLINPNQLQAHSTEIQHNPFASPALSIQPSDIHVTIPLRTMGTIIYTSICTLDTIYIKSQVFRLLRYYSPAPRKIARSDWATQNITHNMTSSLKQPYGVHSH